MCKRVCQLQLVFIYQFIKYLLIICPDRTTLSTNFLVKHYESDNKIHQIVRYGFARVTDFQL